MANKRLVTLLGTLVNSDDMAVAQSYKVPIGTMIELLIIEFDQEKYGEFLSSGSTSPKYLWKYCKISINLASNETKKTTVQGNLPRDSQDLFGLKGEFSPIRHKTQGRFHLKPILIPRR